ncbi:HpcH/HpaI aldolase/citrate lyase family protein [Paracoccus xiamenensis]|uniref:HpcH/HpaI aldolase/citrate lyase family protein n=1 Tax=Paracoccus xiamenensis TaxID=2714901 RepID=UPI001408923A|nr:CoA ester lyase [Paracoccus xiamenensis]NHF74634.1 CoA ester lyase [Paracoccus xiamenensis]
MTASVPLEPSHSFPLFVPADRPDRFAKACAAAHDSVVIDVEDAVAPESKAAVRRIPEGALPTDRKAQLLLRVNAVGTPWHRDDVGFAVAAGFDGVMLPKVESGQQVADLRAALNPGMVVIALVESALGLSRAEEIAAEADRLAFGSIDFAWDLGCAHARLPLLSARARLVMAARLAGKPAPLDGVTVSTQDATLIASDAQHAAEMGFGGKLLIHPRQVAPALRGFRTDAEQLDWARRVVAASGGGSVPAVDGEMVDAPVVARARRILQRAELQE